MAAIDVAQSASCVVILGEEECSEGAAGSVLAEESIHGAEEALWLIQRESGLAAKIGLEIGHQESRGDSFSRDVTDDQAEAFSAQIKKIVIVAAHLARLVADARVFERAHAGKSLWKQPGLHLLGNFQFLGGVAFGILTIGDGAALRLDGMSDFVKTDEGKRIAVGIAKAAEHGAPDWRSMIRGIGGIIRERRLRLQSMLEAPKPRVGKKMDAALAPFAEFGEHVFGNEGDVGGAADLLKLLGVGARDDEREVGGTVGRTDDDPGLPGLAGLRAPVKNDLEPEQVQVEAKASVKIPHIDHHRLQAQKRLLALKSAACAFWRLGRDASHARII